MSEAVAAAPSNNEVHRVTGWRVPAIWMVAMLIRIWSRTLRYHTTPEDWERLRVNEPVVVMFWHNRLFFVPWGVRVLRNRMPVYGLVSASRDGAVLARLFQHVGIRTVRGSSSRLGREALHQLIAIHRQGCDVAITPDGPRGPVYDMKAGALLTARRSGSRMMLIGVRYESAWRARSWDGFLIPRPFSRVVVRGELIEPGSLDRATDVLGELRARLLTLSGESDSLYS